MAANNHEWTVKAATSGGRWRDHLLRAVVDGAGPVLYSPSGDWRGVILCLAGLGSTKEKLAASKRSEIFESNGFACVLADHYNEGERRDKASEPLSNRVGWSRSQKAHFWKAIYQTANTVPMLVDFALATFGTDVVLAYGSSMGGDAFLASLCHERRLRALVAERSTPDWLRPGSTANELGESEDGDALYAMHAPCNRVDEFLEHPTAVLFVLGESDTHVPRASAEAFVAALHERGVDRSRMQCLVLPSGGWEGHILVSAGAATDAALEFYANHSGVCDAGCRVAPIFSP